MIVLTVPNSILTQVCEPVKQIDKTLIKTITKMAIYIKTIGALGLAAPQIGINKRFMVMKDGENILYVINPKITILSENKTYEYERCLSIPGFEIKVPRYSEITLHFMDHKNRLYNKNFKGLEARIAQHEVDHLEGLLINRFI